MLVPFMQRDRFIDALPDGLLPDWKAERQSVWLTITVPTEADVVMAKLVMPSGWRVASIFEVGEDGVERRIDSEDVNAVVDNNQRLD